MHPFSLGKLKVYLPANEQKWFELKSDFDRYVLRAKISGELTSSQSLALD
jgi:hypothetical protein